MAKRKLSFLQEYYRNTFLELLHTYGVSSPAQLKKEEKKAFFTAVKKEWALRKAALAVAEVKEEVNEYVDPITDKKEGYAKVKISRPTVSIEPKKSNEPTLFASQEENLVTILSKVNAEQTPELKIQYDPNDFFNQPSPYSYPVVKMPQADAYLKLPRQGRGLGKGYKEDDFYKAICIAFPNLEVKNDVHLAIPHFNRPYEPDIVLIDKKRNLYIDIEIDEPYDGYFRFPTHEIEKDDTRDLFFNESGWIVIRFTERQVHLQESACIAYIKDVIQSIYTYQFEETSDCESEVQWDYQKAIRWEKEHYREKYLGIQKFGKQARMATVVVDVDEKDSIEQNINRTKKYESQIDQVNVAFEDETHKYHHPKDDTGNAEYISVTTLIDRFFPFDLDRFIQGKAKRDGLSEAEVLEEFIKTRDEAAEKGTYLHEQIENFLKGKQYDGNVKELLLFNRFYKEVVEKRGFEFVEAEKRILLEEYNVAGTIDALFKKPNSDEYIIIDWKRSKKLVIDGHPKKYGYGQGLSELAHLENSSYYKYALQQNIYKYILETKYGLRVSSLNLIVLHEKYDNYYRIDLPSTHKEVKIILNSTNHKI